MKHLIIISLLLALASVSYALWAANLLWYSLGNITGGINSIVNDCPDDSRAGCAIGALQLIFGVIGSAAGAYGTYFGAFKRSEADSTLILYENGHPMASIKKRASYLPKRELQSKVKEYTKENPLMVEYHHKDGQIRMGQYHYNNVSRLHMIHGSFLTTQYQGKTKREVVGGNDGFGAAFSDGDTGTWSDVDHASGDTNEWAQLTYAELNTGNFDSLCVGFKDPDNSEDVSQARVQPATDGDYSNLNMDACNGDGFRKKKRNSVSKLNNRNVCMYSCHFSDPSTEGKCLDQGGSCQGTGDGCHIEISGGPANGCNLDACVWADQCTFE